MSWDALQRDVLEAMGHVVYDHSAPFAAAWPVPADPLAHALLRAAGRSADAPDAGSLCKAWGPIDGLRDPVAKRALWPSLRATRATSTDAARDR